MLPMLPRFHTEAPGGLVSASLEEYAPKHLPEGHPAVEDYYREVARRKSGKTFLMTVPEPWTAFLDSQTRFFCYGLFGFSNLLDGARSPTPS